MRYLTIRADIKDSRNNLKYNRLEELINKILKNQFSEDKYKSINKLEIRNGDEIFGVYEKPKSFIEVLKNLVIEANTLKIPLYIGVGVGNIDDINKDYNLINGSSIWYATEAIKYAENNSKKYNVMINKDLSFSVKMKNENKKKTIIILLYTYFDILTKRTKEQSKAVKLYDNFPKIPKNKLYEILTGRSFENPTEKQIKSSVRLFDKFLNRAQYNFVNDITENIIYLLEEES